eukprot:scaffold24034_cov57-Phaeocystis_antarctica.AAC.1
MGGGEGPRDGGLGGEGGGGRGGLGEGGNGLGGVGDPVARSTGSHCGGHTTGWLASASLLATLGFVVSGMKAA